MAMDLNSCSFVGRLTRDAELKYSKSNLAICRFSIAINRRSQVNGQWQDVASFLDMTWMGKGAETCNQYLTKGRQVAIQAEATSDTYEDRSGQKRKTIVFMVRNLQLLGDTSPAQAPPAGAPTKAYQKATAPGTDYSVGPERFNDDEVPF